MSIAPRMCFAGGPCTRGCAPLECKRARNSESSPSDKNGDAFLILGYEDTPDFAIARTRDEVRAAILKIMWGGCETDEGRIKEELDEYMEWWDDDDHWCIERSHWSVRFEIGGLEAWRFPAKILTPVFAGCGCIETYPQLVPGKVSHGPGCALSAEHDTEHEQRWPNAETPEPAFDMLAELKKQMAARSSEGTCDHVWHGPDQGCRKCGAALPSVSHERQTMLSEERILELAATLRNPRRWYQVADLLREALKEQAAMNTPIAASAKLTNEGGSMDTPTPHSENLRTLRARVDGYLAPAEHDELERAAALLELAFPALLELGHRIEKCGASPELTHAVTLCSDLRAAIGNRWNRADRQAEERVRADLARDDVKREINERIHQEDRAAGRDNAAQRGT